MSVNLFGTSWGGGGGGVKDSSCIKHTPPHVGRNDITSQILVTI